MFCAGGRLPARSRELTDERAHTDLDRRRRAGGPGARGRSRLARRALHADRAGRRPHRAAARWTWSACAPWSSAAAGASPIGCATRPIRATIRRIASSSPGSTATSSAASRFRAAPSRPARRKARRSASACPQDMFDPILKRFATSFDCVDLQLPDRAGRVRGRAGRRRGHRARHAQRRDPHHRRRIIWSAPTAAPAWCARAPASP